MAPRTVYGNLIDGLNPLTLWDQSLADMGHLATIPCTATANGNAYTLTPIQTAFAPNVTAYANYNAFSFVAPATSTGNVTISVAGLPGINVYVSSSAQAGANALGINTFYVVAYVGTLNGGAGGFALQTSAATMLSSNNVWTGNQYFKSGSPWADVKAFGAVGDFNTDDTAAIQAAVNSLPNGGIVYFPPGLYYTASGIVHNTNVAIRFVGASRSACFLSCRFNDVTTLFINGSDSTVENLTVSGCVSFPSAGHNAITLGTSAAQSIITDCQVDFGYYGIDIRTNDFIIENVQVTDAYGPALIHTTNGGFFKRVQCDQNFPVSGTGPTPAQGSTFSAWQANHAYNLNDVAIIGGYYIQVMTAGTTGSVIPTLAAYNNNMNDGSVVWQLLAPTTFYGIEIDGGSFSSQLHQTDTAGPFTAGIILHGVSPGGNGGAGPGGILMSDLFVGETFGPGVWIRDGQNDTITGSNIGSSFGYNGLVSAGIYTSDNFVSGLAVTNCLLGASQHGIYFGAGTSCSATSNIITSSVASAIAVRIGPGLSGFTVTGNTFGTPAAQIATGVQIELGADSISVIGNIFNVSASSITDHSFGIEKLYQYASGAFVLGAAVGGPQANGSINLADKVYFNGNSFTTSGAFTTTLTVTANSNATLPAGTHTIAGLDVAQTWSGVQSYNSGDFLLKGSTSGTTTVNASATASGVLTMPAATDTLIGKATTDTLTNKTFDTAGAGNSLKVNGTALTAVTGTGNVVLSTSPTFAGTPVFTTSCTMANLQSYILKMPSGTDGKLSAGSGGGVFFDMGSLANAFFVRDSSANAAFSVFGPSDAANAYVQINSGSTTTLAACQNDFYGTKDATNATTASNQFHGGISVAKTLFGGSSILTSGASGGVGYATGAGSAVTQLTSRATGVTINTPTGAITLVSAAGSATPATFTITNSSVAATDVIHVSQKSGTDKYQILVTAVAAGSFAITCFTTGGTTTEQPVFNFAILKGAAS